MYTKRLKEQRVTICLMMVRSPPLRYTWLHCVYNDPVLHVRKVSRDPRELKESSKP